jgi:hypothetical protein
MEIRNGEGVKVRDIILLAFISGRRLRWTGHTAGMKEGRSAFKILAGNSTRKRPPGRPNGFWSKILYRT